MKTKKLWIWSLTFGIIATLLVYFGLVSNLSASSSTKAESEPAIEEVEEEAPVNEPLKREMENPIIEVSEGKRAISLQVLNLPQGTSGYLEPDSYVDIIAYGTEMEKEDGEEEKREFRSAILALQNIKVLATGKSADNAEESLHYETVTVEVTPEEGVMLSLAAKDVDGFYFMLRNPEDKEIKEEAVIETREVFREGGDN